MRGTIGGMDANTARTLNMRRHVENAGGPAEFARRFGGGRWVAAQVSQWISEVSPKGIGRALARDLEQAMGLTVGELDRLDPSQSAGLDPAIVAASFKLLREAYAGGGVQYDPERDPDLFCETYAFLADREDLSSPGVLIDFGRRLAERQRSTTGGSEGERQAGGAGEHDRGSREKRGGRKA